MPEQLSNDALKLAAHSTARAITKKKDLSITKRNWNNFPSSEVHIPLPPRAKRKLDQWRGSLDTQLFWKKFHKNLKEELIKIHINNINTLLDYKESRRIIENMVGTIQMKIISFDTDEIGFEVRMLGGFKTLEKQITENSFFEIIQGSLNDKYLLD